VARHQSFTFAGEMQQPRSALEYFKLAIAQERHLTALLTRQMAGIAVAEGDCSNGIIEPSFLARPSESYVAHKTTRCFGHPIEGPNDQSAHDFKQSCLSMRLLRVDCGSNDCRRTNSSSATAECSAGSLHRIE